MLLAPRLCQKHGTRFNPTKLAKGRTGRTMMGLFDVLCVVDLWNLLCRNVVALFVLLWLRLRRFVRGGGGLRGGWGGGGVVAVMTFFVGALVRVFLGAGDSVDMMELFNLVPVREA